MYPVRETSINARRHAGIDRKKTRLYFSSGRRSSPQPCPRNSNFSQEPRSVFIFIFLFFLSSLLFFLFSFFYFFSRFTSFPFYHTNYGSLIKYSKRIFNRFLIPTNFDFSINRVRTSTWRSVTRLIRPLSMNSYCSVILHNINPVSVYMEIKNKKQAQY